MRQGGVTATPGKENDRFRYSSEVSTSDGEHRDYVVPELARLA